MIISVDTGNKQMKTENCEFNSGVEILDTLPGELEEVIEYEGKYYRTTNRRISYIATAATSDRKKPTARRFSGDAATVG